MKPLDLHDLLAQKLEAFTSFLSATMSLQELSESENDLKGIESLLKTRQDSIETIDGIDKLINSIVKGSPDFVSTLPGKERKRIKAITEKLDDTASKAAQANRACIKMLRFKNDHIKKQLLKTRHMQHGIQGYARKGHKMHDPRFLDIRL